MSVERGQHVFACLSILIYRSYWHEGCWEFHAQKRSIPVLIAPEKQRQNLSKEVFPMHQNNKQPVFELGQIVATAIVHCSAVWEAVSNQLTNGCRVRGRC